MKKLLLLCFVLLPLLMEAQTAEHFVTYITIDSLPKILNDNWRFRAADAPAMASPDFNDSTWEITSSRLILKNVPKKESEKFNGVGWIRLHIIIDSSLVNLPIALDMTHPGASEIYLDGKLVTSYGSINSKDSSVYFDHQETPFIIYFQSAGSHLIAVRYANYNALRNNSEYQSQMAGFEMNIKKGNYAIKRSHDLAISNTFVFALLFGIFIALSMLHMFLYMYYRAARSNLFFSLFCFALAFVFLLPFINKFSGSPEAQFFANKSSYVLCALACFSLSGFSNELFGRKRLRFYFITAYALILILISLFGIADELRPGVILSLIGVVSLEAVVLTISAIFRKIKGARIIGFGILMFALLFLIIVSTAAIDGIFELSDSTLAGEIFSIFVAISILSIPISMSVYQAWSFSSINKNLAAQLLQVKILSDKTLEQEQEKQRMLESRQEELEREVSLRTEEVVAQKVKIEKQHEELKNEKKKSDDLLLNILPEEIADELKQKGFSDARYYDHVSVMFTDFVDFTKAAERMTPKELVDELHACFKAFDDIITNAGIEKIKTIGDAYLAVCGLPLKDEGHAVKMVTAAFKIVEFIQERKKLLGEKTFDIRVGINSGSVVAGIVGIRKFAYDVWGDTVNTAARLEQHGEVGRVNVSQQTYELINDHFECTYRGEITAKNKGSLKMYFVDRLK